MWLHYCTRRWNPPLDVVLGGVRRRAERTGAANEGEGIWRNMMAMGVTHQLLRLSVSIIPRPPHLQYRGWPMQLSAHNKHKTNNIVAVTSEPTSSHEESILKPIQPSSQSSSTWKPQMLDVHPQQGRLIGEEIAETIYESRTKDQQDVRGLNSRGGNSGVATLGLNRRSWLVTSMAALGGVAMASCPCCSNRSSAWAAEVWEYGQPCGPKQWGGKCASGRHQSPIDVPLDQVRTGEGLGELIFDYKAGVPTFVNTGHGTMQVNLPAGQNKLRFKGTELELKQFHFHSPSEHAFDGQRYSMEAHLVHRDVITKSLTVIGGVVRATFRVMLDGTHDVRPNEALAAALKHSPLEHGVSVSPGVQVSAASLLPYPSQNGSRQYLHYMGSLTTPTCDENVNWFLLETPLQVPNSQVVEFMEFVSDKHSLALNARPLQPLGDRSIFRGP